LKSTRAFWLLHHENKAGQISGDWGRHPDTKVQLQQDGNQPRTKLVWEKTRWATLPTDEHPKALLLDWIIQGKGYRVSDIAIGGAVSDAVLRQRLTTYLHQHPTSTMTAIKTNVSGSAERLTRIVDEGVARGDYLRERGDRGAKLISLAHDTTLTDPPGANDGREVERDEEQQSS